MSPVHRTLFVFVCRIFFPSLTCTYYSFISEVGGLLGAGNPQTGLWCQRHNNSTTTWPRLVPGHQAPPPANSGGTAMADISAQPMCRLCGGIGKVGRKCRVCGKRRVQGSNTPLIEEVAAARIAASILAAQTSVSQLPVSHTPYSEVAPAAAELLSANHGIPPHTRFSSSSGVASGDVEADAGGLQQPPASLCAQLAQQVTQVPPAVLLIGADDQSLHKEFATLQEAVDYLGCEESDFAKAKDKGLQAKHDGQTWYTIAGSIHDYSPAPLELGCDRPRSDELNRHAKARTKEGTALRAKRTRSDPGNCTTEGCTAKSRRRGLCFRHGGRPDKPPADTTTETPPHDNPKIRSNIAAPLCAPALPTQGSTQFTQQQVAYLIQLQQQHLQLQHQYSVQHQFQCRKEQQQFLPQSVPQFLPQFLPQHTFASPVPKVADTRGTRKGGSRVKVCVVDGCSSKANSKGQLCHTHGGKPCSVDGCSTKVQAQGLCFKHGGGDECIREGCTNGTRRKDRLCFKHIAAACCTDPGCNNPQVRGTYVCAEHGAFGCCKMRACDTNAASTRRKCAKHDSKTAAKAVVQTDGGTGICSFDNCTTVVNLRGLTTAQCAKHIVRRRKSCKKEGCSTRAVRFGLCCKHGAHGPCTFEGCTTNALVGFEVCRKHGGGKQQRKACSVVGCSTLVRCRGLCTKHGANRKQARYDAAMVEGCVGSPITSHVPQSPGQSLVILDP